MFKAVSSRVSFPLMEERTLRLWKSQDVFRRSVSQREGNSEFVVYEGPPTANGLPGIHHVLARSFKDLFPRYKTMRGFHVLRRGGWDTHGLPVEIEVERSLGINNKRQIEAYGIAQFNELCRQSAFAYISQWERLTDRIAYWTDLERAYVTYTNPYIESVWWNLSQLWEKKLLYQSFKVVPYCPRCGTPLSDHEVAQGYHETVDPSAYVRLPLSDEPGAYLLIWTTTPWTLPANVAVAVHPDIDYVEVERSLPEGGTERLVLAEQALQRVFGDEQPTVAKRMKGKQLLGKHYQPLYTFLPVDRPAFRVVEGDFVSTAEGTGLVHMAPAYGEDDMRIASREDLPMLMTVADDGTFISAVRPWAGYAVKDADPLIIQDLRSRGLLLREEPYRHEYPFCWRCGTALLYFARTTWYIRTSAFKDRLLEINEGINWYPEHVKHGRFGNWLENNVDWALGRERFWGTPLPIWECTNDHYQECVGSVAQLSELAGRDLSRLDLHRPYVDEVRLKCPRCGGEMRRVPEVIDVWFDSGSMPVAQWHYPFENREEFANQFPADFICEAMDQTRGWFYSLHAISTLLFDQTAFRNVLSLGLILDADGQKMSKSRGNVVDPWQVIDQHGSDAIRWYFYSASPAGQERRFSADLVGEVVRGFMLTLWNTYGFLVTYANVDGWRPGQEERVVYSDLDRWIRSELYALVRDVTADLEDYDAFDASRAMESFVDKLSNWYLRRSRRRFWKSGSDDDKEAAYSTLYEVLVTLSKLLAPMMPFLAEELYQNLVRSVDDQAPVSVHLCDWPAGHPEWIDESLNQQMSLVMRLASLGRAARNKASIKVRQPLREVAFGVTNSDEATAVGKYADLLQDELNVKHVRVLAGEQDVASFSLHPLPKQLGQKYGARFPAIREVLSSVDSQSLGQDLLAGKEVEVVVGGERLAILPEEVEVRVVPHGGYVLASDGPYLAALETELDEALLKEGLAREFVRHVQDLRKQGELQVDERIRLYYHATPRLDQAVRAYQDYIKGETLAIELVASPDPSGPLTTADAFDGESVMIAIEKSRRED